MTHTIKILDTGLDRYQLEPQEITLGRQYDNEADEIIIERPEAERDSLCIMIVTDVNGGYVDHIPMNTDSYKIKSNVSMHRFVKIGFRFARQDGYTKNSEIAVGQFLTAQRPYDFSPSDPTQKQDIDYLIGFGFTGSRLYGNELQFFNMNGGMVVAFDLSPFMQEQSDLGETDVSRETFVKGKKTSNLRNDGEDGTSPYATQEWTLKNAGKIDTISVNGVNVPADEDKNVNLEVLETKGGMLTGDLSIQGNLNVAGTTTTLDTQTLLVKDNIIVTNSDKAELLNLSGLAMNKNANETYGLMYDPADDTVKFGLGSVGENGAFTFSETANAMAVRADSSLFVDGNLVKWDGENKRFVDSGKSIEEIDENINSKMDKANPTGTGYMVMNPVDSSVATPGNYSAAFGASNSPTGDYSFVAGYGSSATQEGNIAMGYQSEATGAGSIALGHTSKASGDYSFAAGGLLNDKGTAATGDRSVAIGCNNLASGSGAISLGVFSDSEGLGSVAINAKASGKRSIAIGGTSSVPLGGASNTSRATAEESVAIGGYRNSATGEGSAAIGGYQNGATGYRSTAVGGGINKANARYSFVTGEYCIASGDNSHVIGKYNVEDADSVYAEIVGNGASDGRSNARTLDWDGNCWVAGKYTCGADNDEVVLTKDLNSAVESLQPTITLLWGDN